MRLEIKTDLELNSYSATFNIVEKSALDEEKLKDFGIISINCGGQIPITIDGNATTFKVTDDIKKLPNDFPFTKTFKDATYDGQGKLYANAYIAEIEKRVVDLIAELDSKVDDFSGVRYVQL